jgi:hypothetical protein
MLFLIILRCCGSSPNKRCGSKLSVDRSVSSRVGASHSVQSVSSSATTFDASASGRLDSVLILPERIVFELYAVPIHYDSL